MIPLNDSAANSSATYTNGIVKEAPFYSGRCRPLRVVCVGAGAAGIYLGIKLPRTFSEKPVELQIYEKNPQFGGCWYENVYPGCACDIPSHVYSYSFAPNPDWTQFYASSSEIQEYFQSVAVKYNVPQYVKFQHKVTGAVWDEGTGQWKLRVQLPDGTEQQDFCDILVNAGGLLNAWRWPDIEGLETFKGPRLHSANWDKSVNFNSSTNIAVIGNGSSGVQIVPKLQPLVKRLDTYIRSKTWIALPFANETVKQKALASGRVQNPVEALINPETANPAYTEIERKRFHDDPQYLRQYRKEIEQENNSRYARTHRKDSPAAIQAIWTLSQIMRDRLKRKPELAEMLIPDWNVGCRRLTPGVGYLEALCEDNVSVVTSPIQKIVENGIVTIDGDLHPCDILVCATGFDVSTRPHFEVEGRDGYTFSDEWATSPKGYLATTMSGMPNYFLFNGPNAPILSGSLIPAMEAQGDYIVKMIDKVLREDIGSICVKDAAQISFCDYVDVWMARSIWSSGCRSWYKGGIVDGRVSALWPGSTLHFIEMMKHPRFEDFDYTYLNKNSPFAFMGNGLTLNDVDPQADKAPYLDDAMIDI